MSERYAIVAVTEADEAAAHAIWHLCDDGPYCDLPKWLVQAFARHRATHAGEVERLREALEQIIRWDQQREWTATTENPETHWEVRDGRCAKIARQALEASR